MKKKIFLILESSHGAKSKGYIIDISYGGFGVVSVAKIKKGSLVKIKAKTNLLLPMNGRIVYAKKTKKSTYPYRIGIELASLGKREKDSLKKFIGNIQKRKANRLNVK